MFRTNQWLVFDCMLDFHFILSPLRVNMHCKPIPSALHFLRVSRGYFSGKEGKSSGYDCQWGLQEFHAEGERAKEEKENKEEKEKEGRKEKEEEEGIWQV